MDKEKIEKWYLKDNLSQRQIAKKMGCSQFKVKYLMKEYGINARTFSEAQKVNKQNPFKQPKTKAQKKHMSKVMTESWKRNPNQGMKGKKISEATKRKMSDAQIVTGQGRNTKEYKKLSKQLFDGKCLKCRTKEDGLHVHHKDGNHYNNLPGNLELLCRSCHISLHRKKDLKNGKKLFGRK